MDQSSANHLRHHPPQVVGGSSSSSNSSSSSQPISAAADHSNNNLYGGSAATGGDHGWTQNFNFCNPLNNHYPSSDHGGLVLTNQPHLSFQWNAGNSTRFTAAAVKDEEGSSLSSSTTSSDPFPRFTDMLISNSPSVDDTSSSSSAAVVSDNPSSFGYHGQYQFLPFNPSFGNYGNTTSSSSSSSLIYPSINVSSLNQTLDQNLLFGTLLRDHHHYPGADPMRQYCSPTVTKVSSSELTEKEKPAIEREVKRCNSGTVNDRSAAATATTAQQGSSGGANKKSKVEQTRASCPPFKVRKEKLGDRITALQQLVAPFGKTDTASVLMEAIGYINFLQNQVETLSVPYMKSNRSKPPQSMHFQPAVEGGSGEVGSCRDLRSRGLCLVPLSCTSYITNIDAGAGATYSGAMWPPPPPPHFGQGTYHL